VPQAVHRDSSTYLGIRRTLAVKSPTSPSKDFNSALVIISMFGDRPASTSLGASIQMEQSTVGKVLSRRAIAPPMDACFSTR